MKVVMKEVARAGQQSNTAVQHAARKGSRTFVIVVFVVFATVVFATVLVVVVIAIEGRKCKHALSLPENTERSREVVHDSARSLVYRILRPSPTDRSKIRAVETL